MRQDQLAPRPTGVPKCGSMAPDQVRARARVRATARARARATATATARVRVRIGEPRAAVKGEGATNGPTLALTLT